MRRHRVATTIAACALVTACVIPLGLASPSATLGIPAAIGVAVGTAAAILAGTLAGALVALCGAAVFVVFVSEFEAGGYAALAVWPALTLAVGVLVERSIRHRAALQQELEQANGRLRALLEAGIALNSGLELNGVLQGLVGAAAHLTGARYAALGVLDREGAGLEHFVAVGLDEEEQRAIGPFPRGRGILGELIRNPVPLRLRRISEHPRSYGFPANHPRMESFLGVPIRIREEVFGNLYLTEKDDSDGFTAADERLVVILSEWAAIAIDGSRSFAAEKLRLSIRSSELERRRWARELHDETLQELGALRVMQESALRAADPEVERDALARADRQVERIIDSLQGLITELRPAALDQLGPQPAVEALVARLRARSGLAIELDVDLAYEAGRVGERLTPELESAIYRIVQEALTNALRHAGPAHATVLLDWREDALVIDVRDTGSGAGAAGTPSPGHGLAGMRERAQLAGGTLEAGPARGGGFRVRARIPRSAPDPLEPMIEEAQPA